MAGKVVDMLPVFGMMPMVDMLSVFGMTPMVDMLPVVDMMPMVDRAGMLLLVAGFDFALNIAFQKKLALTLVEYPKNMSCLLVSEEHTIIYQSLE